MSDRTGFSNAARRARVLLALMALLVVGHAAHAPHVAAAHGAPGHGVAVPAHGHDGAGVAADAAWARTGALALADAVVCAAEADVPARTSLVVLLVAAVAALASRPVAGDRSGRVPAVACRSGPERRALLQVFRL
jgi:hypothetical protein